MRNLSRRLSGLEGQRFDIAGRVPHSESWFAFYMEKLDQGISGEDIGNIRIPLEVIDRVVEAADRADREACNAI
jgi:hypothetical protein